MMSTRLIGLILAGATLALIAPAGAAGKGPPRGFYGVVPQGGLSGNDYSMLADAKVGTLRVEFNWPAVQTGSGPCRADGGSCDWSSIDGLIANAAAAGVRLAPTFYGAPGFVSKHSNKAPTKGNDLKLWRAFVGAAAQRYGRNGVFWQNGSGYGPGGKALPITDWQIWNEPNSKQFWRGKPNPRAYAKLVKASAKEIQNQDRKATIVLGGMFGYAKQPLVSYLKQLYRVKKIERSFDAIAIHPYSPSIGGVKKQIRSALKTARRAGDRKARIQMTEMGWTSAGGGHRLAKGKKGQASMLKKSFRLLTRKRKAWHIDSVVWFAYNDTDLETCKFCRKSGLVNLNSKPKPAWRAFVRFTK